MVGRVIYCHLCGKPVDMWQSAYDVMRQCHVVIAWCHGEMDVCRVDDSFLVEASGGEINAEAFTVRRLVDVRTITGRDTTSKGRGDAAIREIETHEHNPRGLVGYLPSAKSCRTPSKGGNNSEGE